MPFIDFSEMPWQPRIYLPGEIPGNMRDWLLDKGSLTERLKQQHNQNVHVQVLHHGWGETTESEQQFLNSPNEPSSIREVILFGSGQPVVFARSVLPRSSLSGKNKALLELGNKPLGEYIFSQPELQRGPIEIAELPASQFNQHLEFNYNHETAWGRRSLFYLNNKPISVCEVFLPERIMQISEQLNDCSVPV